MADNKGEEVEEVARPGTPTLDELAAMELLNPPRPVSPRETAARDERKWQSVQDEFARLAADQRSATPELNELLYDEEVASEHGKPLPPLPPLHERGRVFAGQGDVHFASHEPGSQGPGSLRLSACTILTELTAHYLDQAQKYLSRTSRAHEPGERLDSNAVLAGLGEGLSAEVDRRNVFEQDLDPADVVAMMLLPTDLPHMEPGSLVFRLGSQFPQILPHALVASLPDIHAPFCNALFQTRTEFTNFTGREDLPAFVVDIRYVFEGVKDASRYFKKSWRFLSENGLPTKNTPGMTCKLAYESRTNYEIEGIALGDRCRVYRGSNVVSLSAYKGFEAKESLIFVVLVKNVVLKLAACSKVADISLDSALALAQAAVRRTRNWCDFADVKSDLKSLSPIHASFRATFAESWKEASKTCLDALDDLLDSRWDEPEPCKICKIALEVFQRCSGCRAAVYCSVECQKQDWVAGKHKEHCSTEFLLK